MALTQQLPPSDNYEKQLLAVLDAYKNGDYSQRMPADLVGLPGKIADTLNAVIDMSRTLTDEFERVSRQVGKEGKFSERINMPMLRGAWAAKIF